MGDPNTDTGLITYAQILLTSLSVPEETFTHPALRYARYYYPLILFLFFIISITWWGIATSEDSAPRPPPVKAVLNGDHEAARRKRAREEAERKRKTPFMRIAVRFPGGVPDLREADEGRLSGSRRAVWNWTLMAVMVTLGGNATNVVLHALAKRGWWCGKDYVVSPAEPCED